MPRIKLPAATAKAVDLALRTINDLLPQLDAMERAGVDVSYFRACCERYQMQLEVIRNEFCEGCLPGRAPEPPDVPTEEQLRNRQQIIDKQKQGYSGTPPPLVK